MQTNKVEVCNFGGDVAQLSQLLLIEIMENILEKLIFLKVKEPKRLVVFLFLFFFLCKTFKS